MKCSLCEDCGWVCEGRPGRPSEGDVDVLVLEDKNPVYEGPEGVPDAAEAVQAATAEKAPVDVAEGVAGPSGGAEGVREGQLQAERRAAGRQPLPGLPTEEQVVDGELFTPGAVARRPALPWRDARTYPPEDHFRRDVCRWRSREAFCVCLQVPHPS
jgi:hypothetical protein